MYNTFTLYTGTAQHTQLTTVGQIYIVKYSSNRFVLPKNDKKNICSGIKRVQWGRGGGGREENKSVRNEITHNFVVRFIDPI